MPPLLPIADARRLIIQALAPVGVEDVPLADALGRTLRADAVARVSHPPADVSAMDGYALRAGDVTAIGGTVTTVGESAAGNPWTGTVGPGQAVRIFTGAHMPAGADAVVLQEDTTVAGKAVTITAVPIKGRHIRRAGQDFAVGDVGLKSPRRLTVRDIGFLAAMNLPRVPAARRPRIGVLSTGDEIVAPGDPVGPAQIVSANGPGLAAFIRHHGGEAMSLGIVRDDMAALRAAIAGAGPLDLLVTSGGVSVGDHDLMGQLMGPTSGSGAELAFHKIAMRPGKPLLFGRVGALPILGLPGNPVSAMICATLFLGPAIARLTGLSGEAPRTVTAVLGADMPANDGREDHVRATLAAPDPAGAPGTAVATPFPKQDSGMVSALARADALIVRPPHAPAAKAGDICRVLPFDF
ncbi:MAG: molybdopterin molybdotransferase MoeA [Rhodospirillaceae bacterium]|nr:molybdopterin molybdotransferase MoeA [Rhodospirillaceae bacterium]